MATAFKKFTIARLIEPYARKYVGLGDEENFNAFFNPVETTADLADITSDINTVDKYIGKPAYDSDLGEPVWATGPDPGDSWDQATGGGGGLGDFTQDVAGATGNLFGSEAGAALLAGAERNFLAGFNAGSRITTGDDNVGIGGNAGRVITTGLRNIAIGPSALGDNIDSLTGNDNIAIGQAAMDGFNITTASSNIGIGTGALAAIFTGSNNIVLGTGAGALITSGSTNVIIGQSAGAAFTTAPNNVFIGFQSGLAQTDVNGQNTYLGSRSGTRATSSVNSVIIGDQCGTSLTTGDRQIIIGQGACGNAGGNLTGADNIFIGSGSANSGSIAAAVQNTVVGNAAMQALTTGDFNVAMGYNALSRMSTGLGNVALGINAGDGITTSSTNVAIGQGAMGNAAATMTGNNNVAIGVNALATATGNATASNQAIGQGVLDSANGALGNQGMGDNALNAVTSGDFNLSFGHNSGGSITTGSDNIMIGHNAGPTSNQSDRLYIDITENDNPAIGGNLNTGGITFKGSLRLSERADHINAPAATFGEIWLDNTADQRLTFTDDQGDDYVLGGYVQRVSSYDGAFASGTTAFTADNTIPQQSEMNEFMSVTITPKNANNILVIEAQAMLSHSSASSGLMLIAIAQDAVGDVLACTMPARAVAVQQPTTGNIRFEMVAGTTSATTFRFLAAGNVGATCWFNGSNGSAQFGGTYSSNITVTEYLA